MRLKAFRLKIAWGETLQRTSGPDGFTDLVPPMSVRIVCGFQKANSASGFPKLQVKVPDRGEVMLKMAASRSNDPEAWNSFLCSQECCNIPSSGSPY